MKVAISMVGEVGALVTGSAVGVSHGLGVGPGVGGRRLTEVGEISGFVGRA